MTENWKNEGTNKQDIFMLATITHPMARRVEVRRVLNDNRELFIEVLEFLIKQLQNLEQGKLDRRMNKKNLELRYITMGFRGLCQTRYKNPNWLSIQKEESQWVRDTLLKLAPKRRNSNPKPTANKARFDLKTFVENSAPYLTGEGEDPTIPGGF